MAALLLYAGHEQSCAVPLGHRRAVAFQCSACPGYESMWGGRPPAPSPGNLRDCCSVCTPCENLRVSHRLPPTGTDSRRRRGGHALSDAPRTPPPSPKGLSVSERAAWRELWSSPVSALWTSDDVPSVVRLIRLRARLDAEGVASCPVSLLARSPGSKTG